jgi:hypothetical protein
MMMMVDPGKLPEISKQSMEINSSHPVMIKLSKVKGIKPNLARLAIEQVNVFL